MTRPYMLSCHCGAIRLEVDAELTGLHECNCSICARSGFMHWKVSVESVRLVTQKRQLSTYLWRDADGGHFCPTCGTAMLQGPHLGECSRPEGVDIFGLEVGRYDGRNLMPPGPTL
jgi:hypothetical protein